MMRRPTLKHAIPGLVLAAMAMSSPAKADPALWEVRDDDSRIVLFGSVHALPANIEWRTPLLDDAMAASTHVYFETDIGLAAIAVKMMVAAFQSADTPWLPLLTDPQIDQLATALEPLGISIEDAGRMPPWVVAMQLSEQQLSAGTGGGKALEFHSGVEWTLQWALPPERKAYLETPGEQFDMIAAGTTQQQVDLLIAMLGEASAGAEALDRLITAWLAGDVDAITALTAPANENEVAALQALLLDRNSNWTTPLQKLLADNEENLIVVGAAHLAGPGSVLDLLQDAGYTVTRIQ